MASGSSRTCLRRLKNDLKVLTRSPIQGILAEPKEDNMQQWDIYIEGPEGTCYEKGIFRLLMKFPDDYPTMPPSLEFVSEFWHPNIYKDGRVCISILHNPEADPLNQQESLAERWNPTQSVGTIVLSVVSMLNEPNTSSPANIDASVQWKNDRKAYEAKCERLSIQAFQQTPPEIQKRIPRTSVADIMPAADDHTSFQMYDDNLPFDDDDFAMSGDDQWLSSDGDGSGSDDDWPSDDDAQVNDDDWPSDGDKASSSQPTAEPKASPRTSTTTTASRTRSSGSSSSSSRKQRSQRVSASSSKSSKRSSSSRDSGEPKKKKKKKKKIGSSPNKHRGSKKRKATNLVH